MINYRAMRAGLNVNVVDVTGTVRVPVNIKITSAVKSSAKRIRMPLLPGIITPTTGRNRHRTFVKRSVCRGDGGLVLAKID